MNYMRCDFIDFGKAFAIIVVLMAHNNLFPFSGFGIFAIPLFFFASGYLYTPSRRTLKQTVIHLFKRVLLPFWLFMLVYGMVELIRAPYIGYSEADILRPALHALYGSSTLPNPNGIFDTLKASVPYNNPATTSLMVIFPTYCHLWFLPVFFTASILFSFLVERVKRLPTKIITFIILIFLCYLETIIPEGYQLPYGIGRCFLGAAFMLMGVELRNARIFEPQKRRIAIPLFVVGLCSAAAAVMLGSWGNAYIVSYYGPYGILSTYLTFIGGVGAVFCVLYICKIIADTISTPRSTLFSLIGRNTMTIYGWHFIIFFILDVIYVNIFFVPFEPDKYYVSLLPTDSAWWYSILQVMAAIAICVGFSQFNERRRGGLHLK